MRKSRTPNIGVTGPDHGGYAAWFFTRFSVWRAGGKAVRITPDHPVSLQRIDGLIIGGGADVDPGTYGKKETKRKMIQTLKGDRTIKSRLQFLVSILLFPLLFLFRKFLSKKTSGMDKERDKLEMRLIEEAYEKGIPVLGICRGAQLINVFFKGTLFQEIGEFYEETPNVSSIFPVKKIYVEPDSKLAEILQTTVLDVNALHKQAVDETSANIRKVAREKNGVVQAIELKNSTFFIGVQWHPEYLVQKKEQRLLFKSLVGEASKTSIKAHSSIT